MIRVLRDETAVALSAIGTAVKTKEYSFPSSFKADGGVIGASKTTLAGGGIHLKMELKTPAVGSNGILSLTLKHKAKPSDSSYATYAVYGPFKAAELNGVGLDSNVIFDTELPRTVYSNFQIEASGTAFTSGDVKVVVEA